MRIVFHVISAPAPLGLLFTAATANGLRCLHFMDRRSLKSTRARLEPATPGATWEHSVRELEPVARQLAEYFNGDRRRLELPLDWAGSEFQLRVWRELLRIPYGETRTYGQIAQAIGEPRAARAVGLACNQNPLPLFVPCHRVIGADGKMVGYAGGVARKKWLLDLEARFANLRPADGDSVIASLHRVVPREAPAPARAPARRKAARPARVAEPSRDGRAVASLAPARRKRAAAEPARPAATHVAPTRRAR
jgi:methylated-DNA-[protein]-cysteine S-methyltransferase